MTKRKVNSSRGFLDEFSRKNLGFFFSIIGESKQSFVQSNIRSLNASAIMMYRIIVIAYLIFGMTLSIVNNESSHPWILYMTSCTYLFILVYFMFGSCLSWYSVFHKIEYCRTNTMTLNEFPHRSMGLNSNNNNKTNHTKNDISMNNDKNAAVSASSSINGSTCQLMGLDNNSRYSVDSIIFDIEERNKRVSITRKNSSSMKLDLHHARLQDNRLPSMNSEVFLSETIGEVPVILKFYWFLSASTINLALMTVFVYWVLLFENESSTALRWFLRIDRHGIACLLVVIDYVITRTPIRFLHFIYPSILMIIYGTMNGIYSYAEKTFIYGKMNFVDDPWTSVGMVALSVFIGSPCSHLIAYWLIYRAREKVFM